MPSKLHTNDVPFEQAFANPSPLYRGAPFWSWNGALDRDELLRQIDIFDEMGIGGYTIHPRTGLDTAYLGDEYMELVKACRDYGRDKGMLTWLYDEDRWPSGFAGGLVTQDHRYRQRHLLFTATAYGAGAGVRHTDSTASGSRSENGTLLARYAITLNEGYLASYRNLNDGEEASDGEQAWYAYLEVARDSPWFNNQSYVDTLNPQAMRRFIEVTHERYKQAVGDSFGKDVPAIFTDEPQFTHKRYLPFAESQRDIFLPWTDDLEQAFTADYGASMLEHLPEVVWDLPDRQVSIWRYRYHEWVAERFASSFADQIGQWCKANGIALTGHMMEESTLAKQTKALGEAMRSYRAMDIPGIDMLCDWEELNTAKQAQSAARQFGAAGVMSELYGVTGWHYNFEGHKRQGDWQAALGVLFRVHHLSWYCMRGESKRDYPASISYQSPWYKQYPLIEDHFARVAATLSRGQAVCRVAVIHPVESFWLCTGPRDTSDAECSQRDQQFADLTRWMLHGLMDFDFVAESLLPDQADVESGPYLGVGEMQYQAVVVPGMRTIRRTTLERLESFVERGGHVVFAGEVPTLVDAVVSDRAAKLAARCVCVGYDGVAVLEALKPYRDLEVRTPWGSRPGSLVYQMREEGDDRYLFLCYMAHQGMARGNLSIRGDWQITALDTTTGEHTPLAATYRNGQTHVAIQLEVAGHELLWLEPGQRTSGASLVTPLGEEAGRLSSPVRINLDEPNVLLFEKASYAINGGAWQAQTQILDIENVLREQLKLPKKTGQVAQPWTDSSPVTKLADIALRVHFSSRVSVSGATLALENMAESQVLFDGQPVEMTPTGYFTDKSISTIALPDFQAGEHTIEIRLMFTRQTSIEWFYLLGDFGVHLEGTHGIVTEPVRSLCFANWTQQGLPFYGGNVTYHVEATHDASTIQLPQFDGTLVEIRNGKSVRQLYRPPYAVDLPIRAGDTLAITVYGHRANCFGPIHLAQPIDWQGPNAYRTTGSQFSPEYKLKPLGIQSAPILLR